MSYRGKVTFALGISILSACASGGFRQVSLSAGDVTDTSFGLSGHSVYVVPNTVMTDTALEARIRASVEDGLLGQGYTIASAGNADVYVMASFGAVDRFALSSASIVVPAETRIERAPDGSFIRKVYPEHMEHPDVLSLRNSLSILLSASDGRAFRETGHVKTLWQGEASMPGKPELLREMAPYLLTPALRYFGRSSGGVRSIDIRDKEIKNWPATR